jgi:Na+-driven multidrug efflux pump
MLRQRQIFDFFWPLVLTSQMLTLAGPLINMALGRCEDPATQLAAYAVGFGLLVFLNSPLYPFVQTNAVLGVGPAARRSLFGKQLTLAVALALLQLALALAPGGAAFIEDSMGASPAVSRLAQQVALAQWPVPILLTLRSYFQGIVMRQRDTRSIGVATLLRLAALAALLLGMAGGGRLPGAFVGAAALTVAIAVETLAIAWRGRQLLRRGAAGVDGPEADAPVPWRRLWTFTGPLMVNAVTWSAMRPALNAIVGRTASPDLALAGFGLVFPLLLLAASPLWAFASTAAVLGKRREDLPVLMRFGLVTILLFVISVAACVWTPLLGFCLERLFSLAPAGPLFGAVAAALLWIPYQPITLGLRTIASGYLMAQERTTSIGVASLIKLVLVFVVGFALVADRPAWNGALLGTLLLLGSETLETLLVLLRVRRLYATAPAPPILPD